MNGTTTFAYDLTLVMPVYNEEECIESVVSEWLRALDETTVNFHVLLIDDGSRDGTAEILDALAARENAHLSVVHKENSGHGPSILHGYTIAAQNSVWVFQTDSDGEMPASAFKQLWLSREDYDAVLGIRTNREQNPTRRFISQISRLTVMLLAGNTVKDVNVPYRLIRSTVMQQIIPLIPDNTFAPNVAISGLLHLKQLRVLNIPVDHAHRKTGTVSIIRWRLLRKAALSFLQTCAILIRSRLKFIKGRP